MLAETKIQKGLIKTSKSVILIGILALVLGIVAVIYPAGFGKISVVVIGVFLVLGGILRLTFAIISFSMGSLLMRYLYAILMIIAGIWIIMNPDMGLEALTLIMAIYFIIDGITGIVFSFSLMPIGGGMYLLISGVIGVVLGILIFTKWPESSNYALGIYLGIKLMLDGLMLALTGNAVRKSGKNL
jgi:uncharacterized membrane protein HdeD (DUF308 family)